MKRLASVGITLALAASTVVAHADDVSDDARAHFMRGVQLYKDGDFPSALIEFNRAYASAPNYRVKYNVGRTCFELRDYPCALRAFGQFLAEGGDDIPSERREDVASEVKRLQALVARLTVRVNVPGAEIAIDDAVVGTSPLLDSVMLAGGRHKVAVSLPPRPVAIRFVEIVGGESSAVDVTLAEPAASVVLTAPRPAAESPPERSKVPIVVGGGLTVLLAGAAATAGIMTLSAKRDLDDTSNRFGVTPAEVNHARDVVQTRSIVTDVFAGAAVLALAGTVVYYVLTQPSGKPKAAHVPRWLGLSRSF